MVGGFARGQVDEVGRSILGRSTVGRSRVKARAIAKRALDRRWAAPPSLDCRSCRNSKLESRAPDLRSERVSIREDRFSGIGYRVDFRRPLFERRDSIVECRLSAPPRTAATFSKFRKSSLIHRTTRADDTDGPVSASAPQDRLSSGPSLGRQAAHHHFSETSPCPSFEPAVLASPCRRSGNRCSAERSGALRRSIATSFSARLILGDQTPTRADGGIWAPANLAFFLVIETLTGGVGGLVALQRVAGGGIPVGARCPHCRCCDLGLGVRNAKRACQRHSVLSGSALHAVGVATVALMASGTCNGNVVSSAEQIRDRSAARRDVRWMEIRGFIH